MAFTTINGATAADVVTLTGTSGVDSAILLGSTPFIVDALGDADTVTLSNPANLFNPVETTSTTVYGGEGNDIIDATLRVANSFILGGAGNDSIFALGAAIASTEINGNQGDDTIGATGAGVVVAADSLVLGGANNDTIYVGATTRTEVNGNKNADFIYVEGNQTSSSIFGGKGIDTLNLGGGLTYTDTTVTGAVGDDFIRSSGNLTLTRSTISGGEGNDTISMTGQTSAITVDGGDGDDVITLGSGAATVIGGQGADTIVTGTSADSIEGGEGNDTINAGDGADFITGGEGADSITPGAGADVINYTSLATMGAQTGLSTATIDSIAGFATTSDTIKTGLAGSAANFTDGGAIAGASYSVLLSTANNFFTTAGNEAKQYYFIDNGADGFLFVKNSTSLGLSTASLQLTGVQAIVAGDIVA